MDKKKTIIIFINGYLPAKKYGGPVTSVSNLLENLCDAYDIRIISNNHDFQEKTILLGIHEGWNEVGKAKVLYLSEKEYSYKNFKKILAKINADLVYLSSVFSYGINFPAIRAAKDLNIPVLLAPRGEICENALKLGQTKKKIFLMAIRFTRFFQNIYFHATSDEEMLSTQNNLHVPKNKIFLLPNMHGLKKTVEKNIKEKGFLKIIFVSRINQKKNLLHAIEVVSQMKYKGYFDIYGTIEQKGYWEKCKAAINMNSSSIAIKYCGAINPGESQEVFAKYDCFLFPTLSENYGHVIVEAMLAGCPMILSKNTTPWDDIHGNGGFVLDLNDKKNFIRTLNEIAEMDNLQYEILRKKIDDYAKNKLKTGQLKQEYICMFETITRSKI